MLKKQILVFLGILTAAHSQEFAQENESLCEKLKQGLCYSAFYPLSGSYDSEKKSIDKALDMVKDYWDFGRRFSGVVSRYSHPMTAPANIRALASLSTEDRDPYQSFVSQIFQKSRNFLNDDTQNIPFSLIAFDRVISNTAHIAPQSRSAYLNFYSSVLSQSVQHLAGNSGLTKSDQLSWLISYTTNIPAAHYPHVLLLSTDLLPESTDLYARGQLLAALGHATSRDLNLVSYVAPYIAPNTSSLTSSVIQVFAKLTTNQREELARCIEDLCKNRDYNKKREEARVRYNWSFDEEQRIFKSWAVQALGANPDHITTTMHHFIDNVVLYNEMYKEATS